MLSTKFQQAIAMIAWGATEVMWRSEIDGTLVCLTDHGNVVGYYEQTALGWKRIGEYCRCGVPWGDCLHTQ